MEPLENPLEENRHLRRTMRDLVALSTLPAVWIGLDPNGIARSLADVLLHTLSLDLIYIRLAGITREGGLEVVRSQHSPGCADLETVRAALAPLLSSDQMEPPTLIAHPFGHGTLHAAVTHFGFGDDHGILIAGSCNSSFPTEQDRLLLGVGANQTAIVLQRRRAEERLHEQQEWLGVTLASIGDAVIATDTEGRVTFLNPVAAELTGWTQVEAAGQPLETVFTILHEQTRQPVENPVEKVIREGVVVGLGNHTILIAKDGSERPIDDSAAPIRNANGTMIGVVLIFRDVTEQRRAEQELRASEARKSAILETALDCIITMDHQGKVIEFNPAAEKTFGFSRTEVVGRQLADVLIPPSLRERHRHGLAHYLATGEGPVIGQRVELPALHADGSEFPVELAITRISTDGPPLFTAYLRDISERKRTDQHRNVRLAVTQVLSLAASVQEAARGLLQAVCDNLGWDVGFFWTVDEQQQAFLICRQSWHRAGLPLTAFETASFNRTFGRDEGLPGRAWGGGRPIWLLDVAHDPQFPRAASAAEEGLHSAFACPILVGNRTLGVIEFFSQHLREPDADLLEMMGTMSGTIGQFIERKIAEDELRQSEEELADFFENATIGLHWVGADGVILRANQAELNMLGYEPKEYIGRSIREFHADEDVICDILNRLQAGEKLRDFPARMRSKDGSLKQVLIDSSVLWKEGRFVHTRCFTRDVTEHKRHEAILAAQKRVLELLVQGAPLPDVLDALCEAIEEHSQQKLIATVLLMDKDGQRLRSTAGRRAPVAYAHGIDGAEIGPCAGSCGTAAYRREQVIVSDIATDPLWADYRELALSHGLLACWSTPFFSSQGKVLGTFAVYSPTPRKPSPEELRLLDILSRTAGIAVERRRDEEALRDADRRKDEFLATLAHELRNPLAPIRSGLEVMKMSRDDPATLEETRLTMERQTQQLITLVDDLLDISRITLGKLELRRCRVKLSDVVQSAVEASKPFIAEANHEFLVVVPDSHIHLNADPHRLAQVISNLLNNAAKYTPEGGRIRLLVERRGGDAVISVEDNGLGIPAEMLDRIFEMFAQIDQPAEKAYTGLGIGLTLVKSLVEMHEGQIKVESEGRNQGSKFSVQLPILEEEPETAAKPKEVALVNHKYRVLIIDDNKAAAHMLSLVVKMLGNEVQTANDGKEGVDVAAEFRPDVILMDIGMPKMNGYEAARHIRQKSWGKEMFLVALTGWGQDEDKKRTRDAGFNHHLTKPAEPSELQKLFASLEKVS